MTTNQLKGSFSTELKLKSQGETVKLIICFCNFLEYEQYMQTVKFLHPKEKEYFNTLKFEKRIRSYLIGRYAAKAAVAGLVGEANLENILITHGIFTQPLVTYAPKTNIQTSITHCEDFGAAVAFPEAYPIGIDIEEESTEKREVLETQVTENEKKLIRTLDCTYESGLTLFWTAKEALSKVLKTGLMTPFSVFEIDKVETYGTHFINYYKNFGQYRTISFNIGKYFCSITYPKNTELEIEVDSIKKCIDFTKSS